MNISKDVITDLLPVYAAGECSDDTRRLVEQYLKTDVSMEQLLKSIRNGVPDGQINQGPSATAEVRSLAKTRSAMRLRSTVMGFGIFFSLAPFSFIYTQGKMFTLISEAPMTALVYGMLGLACWIVYFAMKRASGGI
jgi:hypothetical protein